MRRGLGARHALLRWDGIRHAGKTAEWGRGSVSREPSSLRFIYETEHHNGIAELLEILGR